MASSGHSRVLTKYLTNNMAAMGLIILTHCRVLVRKIQGFNLGVADH